MDPVDGLEVRVKNFRMQKTDINEYITIGNGMNKTM